MSRDQKSDDYKAGVSDALALMELAKSCGARVSWDHAPAAVDPVVIGSASVATVRKDEVGLPVDACDRIHAWIEGTIRPGEQFTTKEAGASIGHYRINSARLIRIGAFIRRHPLVEVLRTPSGCPQRVNGTPAFRRKLLELTSG